MKQKETIWELLTRLDEQAGAYSQHLHKANQYFDSAAKGTNKILDTHQKDLHKTIVKVRRALKTLAKKQKSESTKDRK